MSIHPIAAQLNQEIGAAANAALELLSKKGQQAYFPSKGILGQTAQAKGTSINATIGTAFENDGSPLTLNCLTEQINLPNSAFLYAPSYGLPDIRAEWRKQLETKNPSLSGKAISNPVVTNALTHGLSVCGHLFVNEGDEILLPDMYWDNYELVFEQAYGGQIKTFNTFKDGSYDVAAMEAALNAPGEKKILLLCFPNNPAGYTVTVSEAEAIRATLLRAAEAGKKIVVILDDAYFGLVYEDGVMPESLFASLCDLHTNVLAVKADGPTKEDYVWGFRVGFVTFGIKDATAGELKALEDKAAGVVRGSISNSSSLGQALLLNAYRHPDYAAQKQAKYATLKERYVKIREILTSHPEYSASFEAVPFNSGYFMCVRPKGVEAEAVRQELLANFSTGVIVLSGLIRIAFSAVPTDKLAPLFENVHQAVQKLQSK